MIEESMIYFVANCLSSFRENSKRFNHLLAEFEITHLQQLIVANC